MRTRDRLIDVLQSVNADVIGASTARTLKGASHRLRHEIQFGPRSRLAIALRRIVINHDSEHVSQLAFEALIHNRRAT